MPDLSIEIIHHTVHSSPLRELSLLPRILLHAFLVLLTPILRPQHFLSRAGDDCIADCLHLLLGQQTAFNPLVPGAPLWNPGCSQLMQRNEELRCVVGDGLLDQVRCLLRRLLLALLRVLRTLSPSPCRAR